MYTYTCVERERERERCCLYPLYDRDGDEDFDCHFESN